MISLPHSLGTACSSTASCPATGCVPELAGCYGRPLVRLTCTGGLPCWVPSCCLSRMGGLQLDISISLEL